MRNGDVRTLSALMVASHASMRDDFEITTPTIDHLLIGNKIGSRGGVRITGGGFSACMVALLPQQLAADVMAKVYRDYRSPEGKPATSYLCRAEGGASRLEPL
jgi:galactokinase